MPALARQEIAEFYLALLIIIIIVPKDIISNFNKTILGTIFLFSFLISHYGIYVFFIFLLGLFLIIDVFLKNKKINFKTFEFSFQFYLLLLGSVLAFFWYYFIGQSSIFKDIIQYFWGGIAALFKPGSESIEVTQSEAFVSVLKIIESFLIILVILVGIIGILFILWKKYKENSLFQYNNWQDFSAREKDTQSILKRLPDKLTLQKKCFMSFTKCKLNISKLTIFSIGSIMILSISLISTYGIRIGVDRVYHWVLFFIAPYCILGFVAILSLINRFPLKKKISRKTFVRIIFIFVLIFFIFSSSLIYYYAQDSSKLGIFRIKNDVNFYSLTPGDIYAANWLESHRGDYPTIAGVYQRAPLSNIITNVSYLEMTYFNHTKQNVLLFFSRANIVNNIITIRTGAYSLKDVYLTDLLNFYYRIKLHNIIYDSSNPTKIILLSDRP
jgi:uncharacterized membrane protein